MSDCEYDVDENGLWIVREDILNGTNQIPQLPN